MIGLTAPRNRVTSRNAEMITTLLTISSLSLRQVLSSYSIGCRIDCAVALPRPYFESRVSGTSVHSPQLAAIV